MLSVSNGLSLRKGRQVWEFKIVITGNANINPLKG